MTVVAALLFALFLVLAVPVGHALVAAGGLAILIEGRYPLAVAAQRLFQPTQSFPLLAIPFFVLAGTLMMTGRLGDDLIRLASRLVGGFRGGLGQVTVLGSLTFGGVCGSAVADASALGSALIPWQKREGYPAGFASALNASASTLAILIPPSIPMIIFATVAEASIADLFVAGILPGVILGVGLLALCHMEARRLGIPVWSGERRGSLGLLALRALPALLMPVLVLGSLRFGVATPTEVSVLAVAYALLVSALLYRDLSFGRVWRAVADAGVTTGVVMLILMASALVQWLMSVEEIPGALAGWMTATLKADALLILAMVVILLIVGTFLDLPAAILLLGPIFLPVAEAIGMDPIQLGVVMTLGLGIGLYTPPVGTTLFVSAAISGAGIGATTRALVPFYLLAVAVLLAFAYVPALTL